MDDSEGLKLGVFLRSRCAMSLALIRSLKCIEGGISVEGKNVHTSYIVRVGERVSVDVPDGECTLSPCHLLVPIVFEGADAIVYDKPAGMAVHPTRGYPDGTLANVYAALLLARNESGCFRPINRLDKNTSGLVLAAKNRYAAPLLAKSAAKHYIALAEGIIDRRSGVIEAPIALAQGTIIGRCVSEDGLPSVTRYTVLERLRGHTLLDVETLTGRTHQIRVHLSHIGHPLAGDDLYGGSCEHIARHALHCVSLSFCQPSDAEMTTLRSRLPEDMRTLIDSLRQND
ncbi:MAG: RluA family pseudouridine synthase [Oscillospiraceae bacterium]